ncbi:MAG: arsenate reductase ArsC [Proteobacteria bacterium]|nr:arsenate reductase ArsC [Pseudomonadota bacterium]
MTDPVLNVLFLCTGNSCRSIIAESLLNHGGQGRLLAFSAGSHPEGRVNPRAIRTLEKQGVATVGLRSKSWHEFAKEDAPIMDFIITICDNAAGEVCPVWPGGPVSAHWGVPDPALFRGNEAATEAVFEQTLGRLERRIRALLELPLATLAGEGLKHRLNEIGASTNDNA